MKKNSGSFKEAKWNALKMCGWRHKLTKGHERGSEWLTEKLRETPQKQEGYLQINCRTDTDLPVRDAIAK